MWFLLLSIGALLLGAVGLPASQRLPVAPPAEALIACYFLLAVFLRLVVRNARLAAFERKAKALARRRNDQQPRSSFLGEIGLGVGKGALQAIGGDVLGAGLSLSAALLRGAHASFKPPPPAPRERRRAALWEKVKTLVCITAVGLICVGVAWAPLLHRRVVHAAQAAQAAWTAPR